MPSRQLSIPEMHLDQLKSAIDLGDRQAAHYQIVILRTWDESYSAIKTHVERWRAENDQTAKSSVFDDCALDVLDMIWNAQRKENS